MTKCIYYYMYITTGSAFRKEGEPGRVASMAGSKNVYLSKKRNDLRLLKIVGLCSCFVNLMFS